MASKRANRFTYERYVEAAEITTMHPDTKELWPLGEDGVRRMPVATYIKASASLKSKMDGHLARANGRAAAAESRLARQMRLAARTQRYILGVKTRLSAAAEAGLTVREFLDQEHAGAIEHWKQPRVPAELQEAIRSASRTRWTFWWVKPNPWLDGKSPFEVWDLDPDRVRQVIEQLQAGGAT